jgi:carbon-monoxide dehydrogenase large subunit
LSTLSPQLLTRTVTEKFTGKALKRREDPVLLAGCGTFVDDIKLPNMLFAGILRSSYGHARIKRVDLTRALKCQGVVFGIAGKDIVQETSPLPLSEITPRMKKIDLYMLASDKVHFMGEPVAALVATDRYTAEDALEVIDVEYEPLECTTDAEMALDPRAPKLYDSWGTNEMMLHTYSIGDPDLALANSKHIFSEKIVRHRYTAAPLECRGYVSTYDKYSKTLNYYASTQSPHVLRTLLAKSLNFPESNIRVIAPQVGGGFGEKLPLYQEEPLIAFLSIKTGRPVKWIETRTENLSSACHSRQQTHYIEIGISEDLRINAIQDTIYADLGAFSAQPGIDSPLATTRFITSGYKVDSYKVTLHAVCTNKAPYGAVRGFGKADANFVIERAIDIVSRKLGVDPVEFRLRNMIQPSEFPYQSCTGAIYDSGDYPSNLKRAAEEIGYNKFLSERERLLEKEGVIRGISISFMLEPSALTKTNSVYAGYEAATIRIDPSGKVSVMTGVAAQGQGHETALSQIVADELGVMPDDVTIFEGDSSISPYGLGNFSSRFSIAGVGAVMLACARVREKLLKIASYRLDISEEEILLERGFARSATHQESKLIAIADIADIAYNRIHLLPSGLRPGIEESSYYLSPNAKFLPDEKGRLNLYPSYTSGAYAVIVELDPETGKITIVKQVYVSDCGNIINPLLLDGQLTGGLAQGIGGALFEELVYDKDAQLVSSTFMDYLLPTSLDVPEVNLVHMKTPSPLTFGGFKGAAEGTCIVAPYGLANAVHDALNSSWLRGTLNNQPLSPENIWREIQKARRAS